MHDNSVVELEKPLNWRPRVSPGSSSISTVNVIIKLVGSWARKSKNESCMVSDNEPILLNSRRPTAGPVCEDESVVITNGCSARKPAKGILMPGLSSLIVTPAPAGIADSSPPSTVTINLGTRPGHPEIQVTCTFAEFAWHAGSPVASSIPLVQFPREEFVRKIVPTK